MAIGLTNPPSALPATPVADGDKGDVVVSSSGTVWLIDANAVTNAKMAKMAAYTFKANITGSAADPQDVALADLTGNLPDINDSVIGFESSGELVRFPASKLLNVMASGTTTAGSAGVDVDSMQMYFLTALAQSVTFGVPGGTPTNSQQLIIRIKDDGTSRSIVWNAIFEGVSGYTLPSATVAGETLYLYFRYNSAVSKWQLYYASNPTLNSNIGSSLTGSGTNNYVAKWTPDGSTLGNSIIQDDGTDVAINTTINPVRKFLVMKDGANAGSGVAGFNTATSTGNNVGVSGQSYGSNAGTNIGGEFIANSGANNYAIKLVDGTQGNGKFLKSNANGEANWAQITTSDISGGVAGGSGTNTYIARWTPDGNTLGDSTLRDDGTTTAIGAAPISTSQFLIESSVQTGMTSNNSTTGSYAAAFSGNVQGAAASNFGIDLEVNSATQTNVGGRYTVGAAGAAALPSATSIGVLANANSITQTNWGALNSADGANSGTNVGTRSVASGGSNNYAIQLIDGTEGSGKFLKSIDANGNANWATITASDISGGVAGGSGTNNYVARWTPDGNTLGNSTIRDDGSTIGIGNAPVAAAKVYAISSLASTLNGQNNATSGNGIAVTGQAYGVNAASANYGGWFQAQLGLGNVAVQGITGSGGQSYRSGGHVGVWGSANNTTGESIGGLFNALQVNTGINVGAYAKAANSSSANYSIWLEDGTEGSGKFLKSVTADGKANWATITAGDISGTITDSNAIHTNVSGEINGITEKTTLAKADLVVIEDSAASNAKKKATKGNLTNPVVTSTASTATLTVNAATTDLSIITAQAAALTVAEPTGSPVQGQRLVIRIKDNGTARAITWNAIFRAIGITLPTTTIISKTMYLGFIYNSTDTKWDCVAYKQEA